MKALVGAFNQEKALVGAFSVITNLRMELFEALVPAEAAVLHRGVAEHGVEGAEAAGQVAASELLGREDGPARHPATTQHTVISAH